MIKQDEVASSSVRVTDLEDMPRTIALSADETTPLANYLLSTQVTSAPFSVAQIL
jgi:hypothetical protein